MPRLPLRSLCGLCAFVRVPAPSASGEACQSLQPFFPDHDRALQNTSQRPRGSGPFLISIPQRQAQKGLAAAKRQLNQQSWFWMWCNMRSPLLCSGSRHKGAANGVAVCTAHIVPYYALCLNQFFPNTIPPSPTSFPALPRAAPVGAARTGHAHRSVTAR